MLKSKVPAFFANRRNQLWKMLEKNGEQDSVFIFPAHPELIRNDDVAFPYRQDSSLYYMSGYEEPSCFLVLAPGEKSGFESYLFVMERDQKKELWDGPRYGTDRAKSVFGMTDAYVASDLERELPKLLKRASRVFYRVNVNKSMDRRVLFILEEFRKNMGRTGRGLLPIRDPMDYVGELRLRKGTEEIEAMKKAAKISAQAHTSVMKEVRPGMNEREIEILLEYYMKKEGCQRLAYGAIVAGGANACCLHYDFNNEELKDGDLLLIDAGGEVDFYAADITRTFPIGKTFTDAQAEVYRAVLKAQKDTIAICKPGLKVEELHKTATALLVDELLSMGILKGKADEIIKDRKHLGFYPHGTGHWLGLDVHDAGLYKDKDGNSIVLEPGMTFTVEPGLYFQLDDNSYDSKYKGIGVRIEDDILITDKGNEVLTKDVPKEIDDILALKK